MDIDEEAPLVAADTLDERIALRTELHRLQSEIKRLREEGTRRMNWILGLIDHAAVVGKAYADRWGEKAGGALQGKAE